MYGMLIFAIGMAPINLLYRPVITQCSRDVYYDFRSSSLVRARKCESQCRQAGQLMKTISPYGYYHVCVTFLSHMIGMYQRLQLYH